MYNPIDVVTVLITTQLELHHAFKRVMLMMYLEYFPHKLLMRILPR